MISEESNPFTSSCVVVAYDATKERSENELRYTVNGIRLHGGILHRGDTLLVLGVLHKVTHPMGYQMQACPESFAGTHIRTLEEEVNKKVGMYVNMLLLSAQECQNEKVDIEVKVTAGTPPRKVVLQEVTTCNANWVILDRHLRRDLRFYLQYIPSKVAVVLDNLSVEVIRPHITTYTDSIEHKLVFSMTKPVPISASPENKEQSVISIRSYPVSMNYSESLDMPKRKLTSSNVYTAEEHNFPSLDGLHSIDQQEKSGNTKGGNKYHVSPLIVQKQQSTDRQRFSDAPLLCMQCGMRTELCTKDSMRFSFSEIQLATNEFSKENLIGEGTNSLVYKGNLKGGQSIAAKVRKEDSSQGFSEFHSEIDVLSFARHKNIVMLLGYCCKENINILVYEYICNKALDWHLFENTDNILEWHHRHAIAVGTAKGLRFLHEECRGSPIIHRDMRPCNILLTHDYVPMLGDFGLAKWKTNGDPVQTRILGKLGYLAPEYAENGIVSVRTDVYAFGIVLIQLISGERVVSVKDEAHPQSLRQWAEPLIERLALHELIDPHIKDSYDSYELYHMARTAYLCLQIDPEKRPSMGEVVRLLEGENDYLHYLSEKFIPHFTK